MKRKIAYITGTRADFGLMSPVLKAIETSEKLELRLYATGVHLMKEFGNTITQVKQQFPKVKTIKAAFSSDDRASMAQFMGSYLTQLVKVFQFNRPDFVLTLGDRVEMLCTAMAAVYLGIPTAQIHGGEKTKTVDEMARHAITKLSHLHFPATIESAQRIKKLGEEGWRIHVVGAPSLDVALNETLPAREELFKQFKINPKEKIILLAQHPVSEQIDQAKSQMEETLAAIKSFNIHTVIVYPHPDPGGWKIIEAIKKETGNPLFHIFPSIGFRDWLALEKQAAVFVGNSSAALIETPSFKTPVVNIGIRQQGRQRGKNVIDAGHNQQQIAAAIKKSLYDKKYLNKLKKITNPWGDGYASEKIVEILTSTPINDKLLTKQITY